jgi:hypothetical protein
MEILSKTIGLKMKCFLNICISVIAFSSAEALSKEMSSTSAKEICKAAIQASDAGWAAYSLVMSDLKKIEVKGNDLCIYKTAENAKCEESVSKIILNNLEHAVLYKFAAPYIEKLNSLCKPYFYNANGALKLPEFRPEFSGRFITKDASSLIKAGYTPGGSTILAVTRLPSDTSIDIEIQNFRRPGSKSVTHSCFDLSFMALAIYGAEDGDRRQIDAFSVKDICIDLTQSSDLEQNEKILNKILNSKK